MTTRTTNTETAPDPNRRLLLGAILASYVCAFVPGTTPAIAQQATPTPAPEDFLAVSRLLTGHATLDVAHANRLYAGLAAADPAFTAKLHDLAEWIAQNKPEPSTLQAALDTAKAPFAKLPKDIATAWYVGVVGSGVGARCVTYETSLMYVAVSDRLKPPSYAYGAYASWSRNPVAA